MITGRGLCGLLLSWLCLAAPTWADVPELDAPVAIKNVTLVPGSGPTIERGTVLIQRGRIVAVGADVTIPAGTRELDGTGMYAYPGFIDGLRRAALVDAKPTEAEERRVEGDFPSPSDGPLARTVEANRNGIFARRQVEELLDVKEKAFDDARRQGFCAALLTPPRALLGGQTALVQLGDAVLRRSLLRGGVSQTASFETPRDRALRLRGRYPATLLGVMAHLRQFFLDAQWYRAMGLYVQRDASAAAERPADPDLQAWQAVIDGQPVIWEADSAEEIDRALKLTGEFKLRLIIAGGREAWKRADALKQAGVPVIVSLKFPAEPRKFEIKGERLKKESDDQTPYGKNWENRPLLPRRAFELAGAKRDEVLANAAKLEAAGVNWCFAAGELGKSDDLLKNLRAAIKAGLSVDAALRGLTASPARLFGAEADLGALAVGRRGNVTVLSGPLDSEKSKVRWVFVDGKQFDVGSASRARDRRTGPGERRGRPDANEPREARERDEADRPDDEKANDDHEQPAASAPASAPAASRPATAWEEIALHEPKWQLETPDDRRPRFQTGGDVLLANARVISITGADLQRANVLVKAGKIAAIGADVTAPPGVRTIDLDGYVITAGVLDPHSHIALDTVNEWSQSVTPEVRCEDVIDPGDPDIYRALAGGCTAIHAMHGSANTIGGQCVLLKMKYGKRADDLLVPDRVRTVKWALGENVIRGGKRPSPNDPAAPRRFPGTRMGVEATLRRALTEGREYAAERAAYEAALKNNSPIKPLRRDLRLEALADILEGKIWVNTHCYRADEVLRLIAVAEEFGIRIAVLHHILEGYRIMPEIARHGAGTATFADWWAYKVEAYDAVPHNAGMLLRSGVNSAIKSDSADLMRHMHQEAAKCMKFAGLSPSEALRLVTLNAARQFGLADRIGSLEVGKDADIAVFDGHPLDTFARGVLTLVEGEVYFQHPEFDPNSPKKPPRPIKTFNTDRPATAMDGRPAPLPPAAQSYAITNATLHPVSGPAIESGTIVLREGKIAALGKNVPIPTDAFTIDGAGLHVWPGLINAATQVGLQEIEQVDVTIDTSETGLFQPDAMAVSAFNPHSAMVEVTRAEGVTTIGLIPSDPVIPGRAGLLSLTGWTLPEMLLSPDVGLVVNLPTTRAKPIFPRSRDDRDEPGDDPAAETLRKMERLFKDARLYAEALAATPAGQKPPMPPDPRYDALVPYVTGKKPVLFHVNTYQGVIEALLFAEQLKLRPVILGGRDAWKAADLLASKQVPVIYEGLTSVPRNIPELTNTCDVWDGYYGALRTLAAAGVKFCTGYRGADLAKLLPSEVGMAVAHGLDPDAAMRAMTLSAAEILGVADQLGSLDAGKRGDVIVTTDHPCQSTNVVKYMFINGRPVSLETKHTRDAAHFANRPPPDLPPARTDLKGSPSQTTPPGR